MKVRMKTLLAGPDEVIQPGRVVDLPEAQAQALVDGGYAVAVDAPATPTEVAMATSVPSDEARVDVGEQPDQDAPAEEATPLEASPNEVYVDDPTAQPPEKPAARRGRGRK